MNDEGESDSVDVRLVELATAVTDGSGRPVTGLGRDAFRVFEAGVPQTLDAVRDSRELPLTLGVALDSSASMFEEMSSLQRAAIDFVSLTLDRADRAFVVDFDSEPRLAVELTGDLGTLSQGIAQLKPGGGTALCDALTFSLARLQRVRGRRALVMISDGLGRDERVSWAACQRFVARSGVPVYLLILPEAGPSDAERSAEAAERAAQLVAPSGGRVLRVTDIDRLGAVYAEVQRELRAQYVLSYYPVETAETVSVAGDWREVRVQVTEPGLAVRTARGYYR
jgi:Ca-activated chloride channel family protein